MVDQASRKYIVIVRHGARLDMMKGEPEFIERPYKNEHDTPLSYLGFE